MDNTVTLNCHKVTNEMNNDALANLVLAMDNVGIGPNENMLMSESVLTIAYRADLHTRPQSPIGLSAWEMKEKNSALYWADKFHEWHMVAKACKAQSFTHLKDMVWILGDGYYDLTPSESPTMLAMVMELSDRACDGDQDCITWCVANEPTITRARMQVGLPV